MRRALYVLLSTFLFLLLSPVLLLARKTRAGLRERFGFYRLGALPEGGWPRVWLHGASAGDLQALAPMIGRFRERFPDARIVLTTMTDTGRSMADQRLRSQVDGVLYAPWDLAGSTRRAVRALRPDLLVLEYAEIWPNLIHAAHAAGTRVVLTNGRFSPERLRGYRTLFALFGNPLAELDLLLMREDEEAERALSLGAPLDRVWVTGNTKFDGLAVPAPSPEDEALRTALGLPPDALVLMGGSTHEGEEEILISVWQRLREAHPGLQLVLAPRYVDRAARVQSLAQARGLEAGRRTGGPQGAPVMVLDTIGELARAYRLATVVFVGGSFTPRGGQNILEPAAQGRPVLFGPRMENFKDSVQVLLGRGGIQVADAEQLHRVLSELLGRPDVLANLGALAAQSVRQVSGASQRNVDLVARLLLGAGTRSVPRRTGSVG
ncbi:MAG TPA: glycosyltransferase N-terminal domain-containing protein [Myxococcaceae bacterium]|nr:glycosyltransferase N-terminal domain-containing protein [Myxococcaceae bacterium]